jgi:hypothetical protein
MKASSRRFVLVAITTTAMLCGAVIAFNLLVDPYGSHSISGFAEGAVARPAIYRRMRLAKAYDLRRIEPTAIVLGTSRSHIGLRMSHPGWAVPLPARYNAAFDGATTKEMYAYLLHAQAIRRLRQVVLGLDTWQLNTFPAWTRPDFAPALLFAPGQPLHNAGVYATDLSVLTSVDTTQASFIQLKLADHQQEQWLAPDGQRIGAIFFRDVDPDFSVAPGRYFRDVDRQEISYMLEGPVISSQTKFGPDIAQSKLTSLDYIAKIISFCRDQRIDLRIFLTPAHAHQLEIVASLGGWARLEQGKRQLVSLLAQDAASHPGIQPFSFYDFSDYSSVTTESVPSLTERREMKFYWDSSHFKEVVGDWVLDHLLVVRGDEGNAAPTDFGVQLTPMNIETELDRDRVAQQAYRRQHPDDVALIKALIGKVRTEIAKQRDQDLNHSGTGAERGD